MRFQEDPRRLLRGLEATLNKKDTIVHAEYAMREKVVRRMIHIAFGDPDRKKDFSTLVQENAEMYLGVPVCFLAESMNDYFHVIRTACAVEETEAETLYYNHGFVIPREKAFFTYRNASQNICTTRSCISRTVDYGTTSMEKRWMKA